METVNRNFKLCVCVSSTASTYYGVSEGNHFLIFNGNDFTAEELKNLCDICTHSGDSYNDYVRKLDCTRLLLSENKTQFLKNHINEKIAEIEKTKKDKLQRAEKYFEKQKEKIRKFEFSDYSRYSGDLDLFENPDEKASELNKYVAEYKKVLSDLTEKIRIEEKTKFEKIYQEKINLLEKNLYRREGRKFIKIS